MTYDDRFTSIQIFINKNAVIRTICFGTKKIYPFGIIMWAKIRPLQNTDFRSNSKPEKKLRPQFTAVNKEFDFFDSAEVAFEKVLCKGLKI